MAEAPATARRYAVTSAALAEQAAAQSQSGRSVAQLAATVATYQAIAARLAAAAVELILEEQAIESVADAVLNPGAFTTAPDVFAGMAAAIEARQRELERELDERQVQARVDAEFERLVASLVQDSARSAESVAVASRPHISYVRLLTTPSCSRCAVLAGRLYRWSTGFLRHPGCDCVMLPTTVANPDLVQDPVDLAERGLVTGLSKADMRAIADGADMNQVVNIRRRSAGLLQSGRVLAREGRLTPEGIYQRAETRELAVELLAANGYFI